MYASLDGATNTNKEEHLLEVAMLEEGADMGLLHCVKDYNGNNFRYILPLPWLLPRLLKDRDENTVYS